MRRRVLMFATAFSLLAIAGTAADYGGIHHRRRSDLPGGPPLKHVVVTVSAADIAQLDSVPKVLVAGAAGRLHVPEKLHVYRPGGHTQWTGGGHMQVSAGLVGLIFFSLTEAESNQLLGPDEYRWLAWDPVYSLAADEGMGQVSGALGVGEPLIFWANTLDPTEGDGTLTVTVWYRTWGIATP